MRLCDKCNSGENVKVVRVQFQYDNTRQGGGDEAELCGVCLKDMRETLQQWFPKEVKTLPETLTRKRERSQPTVDAPVVVDSPIAVEMLKDL